MDIDVVADLAAQFAAGRLPGEDYLALVEQELAVALPGAPGSNRA